MEILGKDEYKGNPTGNNGDTLSAVHVDAINPVPTDDETNGFYVGYLWYNSVDESFFWCVDATASAAQWVKSQSGVGGGALSYPYKAKTNTQSAPPGDKFVVWNNATQNSATNIFVSAVNNDGTNIHNILSDIVTVGMQMIIFDSSNSGVFKSYEITTLTDVTAYIDYGTSFDSSGGGDFSNNQNIVVAFFASSELPAHANTHQNGGTDQINVAGLSGLLADDQNAIAEAGIDTTAIHNNVAGEINAVANKATPVAADRLLIEDSEDSFNKKEVQIGDISGSDNDHLQGMIDGAILAHVDDENITVGTTGELSVMRDDTNIFTLKFTGALPLDITTTGVGGRQTGSSITSDTLYDIYVIGDTSEVNTTNVIAVPNGVAFNQSGYDVKRHVGSVPLDGSSDFFGFTQYGRRNERSIVFDTSGVPMNLITRTGDTSFINVDCSAFVPESTYQIQVMSQFEPSATGSPNDFYRIRLSDSVIGNPVYVPIPNQSDLTSNATESMYINLKDQSFDCAIGSSDNTLNIRLMEFKYNV